MRLSERSLGWLRTLHREAPTPDESCSALGHMARTTPAWTEAYLTVLDQLIERQTDGVSSSELLAIRSMIDNASDSQVVGVDFPDMAFDRAEWVGGNLHLGLAPLVENPDRFTYFRVVGAEPRMWDVHGVQNARIESTMSGLNVRVPMIRAEMSLIRSSY